MLSVYPNPADNYLKMQFGVDQSQEFTISLFAQNGLVTKIINQNFKIGVYDLEVDVSDLAPGVYVLSFYNNQFEFSRNIVVK